MADKKAKKGNVITILIIVAAAAVMIFALTNILDIFGTYKRDADSYQELRAYAQMPEVDDTGTPISPRVIDFNSLRAMNPEIVAWITVNDTNIDYPVLYGTDNSFYISHGADKEANKSGAVFIDYYCSPDFSDQNTIIYGHNMKDGSMFADLHKFEDADFAAGHPYVYIYTPDGEETIYKIFAAYQTPEDAETYTISFADDDAFLAYIADCRAVSQITNDTQVTADDKIITLSTCVQGQGTTRYVLQAVKVSQN